ncbi:GntR family transcriptional regulator [Streptomyces sp. LP05-1]|uniref:GntR family transcriptional regulator n=1 Tax=Streptomyces pyxinae TaxID=2970734 RepID=A0ABT2CK21_9ACTN|nr:GntR family transcriptional regulator [Streptomyces sp. LP05-1]MCS0637747.1 GntR family transcriptional regulator [Streptomyces sp. LP05-1]
MARETPYLQVAEALRARIEEGEWGIGDKLPSRAQLAAEYDIGQSVAQRAMELLIIEGLLEGRAGSGTYVRQPRLRQRMFRSRSAHSRVGGSFVATMAEKGRKGSYESRSSARLPAPEHIAARLAIKTGDMTVCTHYEYLLEGRPVQLGESWEPLALTDKTPVVLPEMGPFAGAGIVKRMRTVGVTVARAVEVPRPARATQAQANLLGISVGELVTIIERTYYDTEGRPVETADFTVPDRRWEIAYEVAVPHD